MYIPTSRDIGPELSGSPPRPSYRCATCGHIKLSAKFALEHIAMGHTVLSRHGVAQEMTWPPKCEGCKQVPRTTYSVFCADCLRRHEEKVAEQRARELAERRKSA